MKRTFVPASFFIFDVEKGGGELNTKLQNHTHRAQKGEEERNENTKQTHFQVLKGLHLLLGRERVLLLVQGVKH